MDDLDFATIISEEFLNRSINSARSSVVGAGSPDGICEDCDEPISAGRLAVAPWATRCVTCQMIYEKKQRA